MNLVEVLVASSVVLGAVTGSLGIWALTAHSIHEAEELMQQQRQADKQLLAVQARLQALAADQRQSSDPVPATCPSLEVLAPSTPTDSEPGLRLSAESSTAVVTATVLVGDEHSRSRVFDLAVYGLCAPSAG